MCAVITMTSTVNYDPNALIAEYGYNMFEIPLIPVGGECSRCSLGNNNQFKFRDCIHFGGFPSGHHKNKEHQKFANQDDKKRKRFFRDEFTSFDNELTMFRREIIFPILNRMGSGIEKSGRLNLFTSMRHCRFEDDSMDPSDPRRLSPEITIPGLPLFPMQFRKQDTRDVMEMVQHVFLVFGEICRVYGHKELEVYTYLSSGVYHVYSCTVAKEKFMMTYSEEVSGWSVFDMFYDEKAETKTGLRDHGHHHAAPF